MANDEVKELDHRLARLEKTVASGFFDQRQRMDRFEDRVSAIESKLDIVSESIRGDLKTVLDAVVAGTEEMRRTTDAIRKEHEADRRLTRSILNDHALRIRNLERSAPEPLEPR